MKLTIIANPVAGRGRPFRKIKRYIRHWPYHDWQVKLIPTRGPGHASVIAADMLSEPPDVLAVCGGDGTMKEVVTGLPEPPFPTALLPAGTSNVLARELDIPLDPVLALDIALKGNVRRVDLGSLRGRVDHHFLLMAGIGFDAHVAANVQPAWKKRLGIGSYYLAVLRGLMTYPFDEFRVVTEGAVWPANSCVIANAKGYGGQLRLTPQADISDGLLDVLVVGHASKLDYARLVLSSRFGKQLDFPFVRRLRSALISVEGPRGLWVQADGEPIGTLPIEVTVVPGKYPIIVPSQSSRSVV